MTPARPAGRPPFRQAGTGPRRQSVRFSRCARPASRPSRWGICRSISTASYRRSPERRTACSPSSARSTCKPTSPSRCEVISRLIGSSSTSRTCRPAWRWRSRASASCQRTGPRVARFEMQPCVARVLGVHAHAQRHAALFSELEGVGRVVEQGLLQARLVTLQAGGQWRQLGAQLQAARRSPVMQHGGHVVHDPINLHRTAFQGELAGLDLREFQDRSRHWRLQPPPWPPPVPGFGPRPGLPDAAGAGPVRCPGDAFR